MDFDRLFINCFILVNHVFVVELLNILLGPSHPKFAQIFIEQHNFQASAEIDSIFRVNQRDGASTGHYTLIADIIASDYWAVGGHSFQQDDAETFAASCRRAEN